jgi:hypothetical protein
MKPRFRAKKLQTTSIDSKLSKEDQFSRLLDLEPAENITQIDRQNYTYQIELNYPSSSIGSYMHYQITYKVIARQTGSSTVIRVRNVVGASSKLRKLVKTIMVIKRTQIKWMPRLKLRY